MMIKCIKYFLLSSLFLVIIACEKDPGTGGKATITGKIYGIDIDKTGKHQDSGYVGDIRVFISFGEHSWVDLDTRTSPSGDYAFRWLNPGNYSISVISQCDTCPMGQTGIYRKVTIGKKDTEVKVEDIVAYY